MGPKNAFLGPVGSQGGLPWGSQGALWADWPWAMGRWALWADWPFGPGPMGPGPMGPGTRNEYNVNGCLYMFENFYVNSKIDLKPRPYWS